MVTSTRMVERVSTFSESSEVEKVCTLWSNDSILTFIPKRNSSTCAQEVYMIENNLIVREKREG